MAPSKACRTKCHNISTVYYLEGDDTTDAEVNMGDWIDCGSTEVWVWLLKNTVFPSPLHFRGYLLPLDSPVSPGVWFPSSASLISMVCFATQKWGGVLTRLLPKAKDHLNHGLDCVTGNETAKASFRTDTMKEKRSPRWKQTACHRQRLIQSVP